MKILFIAPLSPPITGQSLISDYLFESLLIDNNVHAINISKKKLKNGDFSFLRFFSFFSIFFNILKANRNVDIVYFTISESVLGNLKDLVIYLLLGSNIKKTIIHIHGGSFKRDVLDTSTLIYKLNMFFLKRMKKIVVLGDSHKLMFDQNVLGDKLFTLPNFVPERLFISEDKLLEKTKGIGKIKILYLSNLMQGKGYDVLIEAFEKLDEVINTKIELHFAGSFESIKSKDFFEARIIKFINVFYHGIVQAKEKKELLASAHIMILPTSFLEGQPLSILEGYANGCAVIATTPPGIKDIFVDKNNGLMIKVNDSEDLKAKIEFLIQNTDLIGKYSLTNYKDAKEKYTSDIFIKNFNNSIT
jgi:glycosyltransferase involved in cell wall biosynthesis